VTARYRHPKESFSLSSQTSDFILKLTFGNVKKFSRAAAITATSAEPDLLSYQWLVKKPINNMFKTVGF